jgi:ABC-type branched-subunit amino acid transport system ATPase component
LTGVDLVIERGEKVAFVGKNGEGKTTLSRILVGELEHDGGLKMGHNVELGYFAQNQDEIMDGSLSGTGRPSIARPWGTSAPKIPGHPGSLPVQWRGRGQRR